MRQRSRCVIPRLGRKWLGGHWLGESMDCGFHGRFQRADTAWKWTEPVLTPSSPHSQHELFMQEACLRGSRLGCRCVGLRGESWGQPISWAGSLAPPSCSFSPPAWALCFSDISQTAVLRCPCTLSAPGLFPLLCLACILLAHHLCTQPCIQQSLPNLPEAPW